MRKFIRTIGSVLLVATLLILLLIYVAGLFGIDRYLVVSGSMEPNLYPGDIAIVNRNIAFDDVQIGDVIIFYYDRQYIIHRVIEKTVIEGQRYLKTKGDANESDDGYLTTADNFCGAMLFHIPKFGFMMDFKDLIER